MTDYHHSKFGLIWIKESKVTEGGGFRPPPGWEFIKSRRWDTVKEQLRYTVESQYNDSDITNFPSLAPWTLTNKSFKNSFSLTHPQLKSFKNSLSLTNPQFKEFSI